MEVAITGASGLIGSALLRSLNAAGHRAIPLVRREPAPGADAVRWDPAQGTIDAASLDGIDAVVHLAGAGIGDRRWSDAYKRTLVDSRVHGTGLIARTIAGANRPPSVFVCGSAIGYYGDRGAEHVTESSVRGAGFLADLVASWEAAAAPAVDAGIRTCFARTGMVLDAKGGALAKQLLLFRLGLGGRFGDGTQWVSWISLTDEIRALQHLLVNDIAGPVNLVSPNPVTNLTFTKTLGRVLRRPTVLPVPLFGPRLLFGHQMVAEVILASQLVIPTVLTDGGFRFDHPTLDSALSALLRPDQETNR